VKHLASFDNAYRVASQMTEQSGKSYAIIKENDRFRITEFPCVNAIAIIQANDDPNSIIQLAS
jgi:hypothetical protein